MARAREAAAEAIGALRPGDTVAVVTYSSTVRVLAPAARLHDAEPVVRALDAMEATGDTALFAGLSKAAGELMKHLVPARVNRIVLLSDGRANVGPGGMGDLVRLAASLRCDGITISTIGLGMDFYEDLLVQLAAVGGGNHFYAATPDELPGIFQHEFTEAVDAAARDVAVEWLLAPGVEPVLALGHAPRLSAGRISANLGPLFTGQEKHLIVEVRIRPDALGPRSLGSVTAAYTDARTGELVTRHAEVMIKVAAPGDAPETLLNPEVIEAFVRQVGSEKNRVGTELMDRGEHREAETWLRQNADQLEEWANRLDSDVLREDAERNRRDADSIESLEFEERRKSMRFYQNVITNQAPSLPPVTRSKGGESSFDKKAAP
jgi:Ca-activated chloride channel family protein